MEIEETALYKEIITIIDEGPKPISFYLKCFFIVDEQRFEPLKIIDITTEQDYHNGYVENKFITLAIPMGLWVKVLYPKLNILDISILRIPLEEISENELQDNEIEEIRYTAVPVQESVPNLTGNNLSRMSIAALDTMNFFNIKFQLVDKGYEALSMITVGGIFRRVEPYKVVQGLLSKETKKTKTISGKAVEFVDVIDGHNTDITEHVQLPQGLKLLDVADYIQANCNGIYNSGINTYYQYKCLFVYPIFDTTRYDKVPKKLTIMKVPKQRFTDIERTYKEDGDIIYILGTNDTDFVDNTFTQSRNGGDGIRYGDSRFIMRNVVQVQDNKAIIERKDINSEYIYKDKSDLPNYRKQLNVQISSDRLNSNNFVQRSRLTGSNGALYHIDWENSNPDLLFPGMMVKIIYLDKDDFKEMYGVLSYSLTTVQLKGQGLNSKRHITNTRMVIFTTTISEQEQNYDEGDQEIITAWENYKMD